MTMSKLFDESPEFPSNVAVANIPVISYQKLKDVSSEEESKSLYEASREHGFFLLDLRGSEKGERVLQDAGRMFDISRAVFDLETEVKLRYHSKPPKDLMGYKAPGVMKTEDGGRDAVELYTLSQDDVLGSSSPRGNPAPIERRRSECQDFLRHAHGIVCELLAHLDKHLGLAPSTLEALNPLDKPSATSVRMLLTRPDPTVDDRRVALGGHTDIGTITMLFNVIGGLQILPAGRENVHSNWRYIRPQPGCAVINIGDSLVVKTGEVLRSGLHRVIMPPGKQASFPRYSLAYLVRPDRSGSMRKLGSTHIIPPLPEGEKDESLSVDDWATNKARQIMNGELKAQTLGGRPVGVNATA